MTETNRIRFFRTALTICAKYGRSPESAITVRGQALPLRQVLKGISDGARLPRITEAEARELARETRHFTYTEILTGLGARRRAAGRTGQARSRRSQRATR